MEKITIGRLCAMLAAAALFVAACDATADQVVSNADAQIDQAAEIIGMSLDIPTSTDDWDLYPCGTETLFGTNDRITDKRVAGRSMEWTGVSEADARRLLEELETRWHEDGTASFSDVEGLLNTEARRDGFSISAWFFPSSETLTVAASTHCAYTGPELREAFSGHSATRTSASGKRHSAS